MSKNRHLIENSIQGFHARGNFKVLVPVCSLILLLVVFTTACNKEASNPSPNASLSANKALNATAVTASSSISPAPINLRTAGNFSILSETGISTTGVTAIKGDIGVSPISSTAITGFGLVMDATNQFSATPIVTGKVYGPNYTPPTPSKMTTAVSDMKTAFTTANGLVYPAPIVQKYAGNISGQTLHPGLYKWSTGVLITNVGVTLSGGPNDVWVFQIAQNLTVNNGAIITLQGGAQAKNIFWIVSGKATLGTTVNFSGNILSKTLISLNTGAKVTGKLLAQTAVTLIANAVHP
ncbi:MAG: ice-binding family protein [Bacteroidota bacterium]|nr:ice-binding family protein [Bacteroidota bacterium]